MANYNFTDCLSPLDFEILSKDLLEAELGIQLENFSEGRDKGIDLRYAPFQITVRSGFNWSMEDSLRKSQALIVQCKRYSSFSDLKSSLKNKELTKITKLNPARYILTTSVSLSPQQVDELKEVLKPFLKSTEDIYGRERLNSILIKHPEIERRHIKLWGASVGVLDSILNAGTHVVSRDEVERTIASAKLYVRNSSFDEALAILKQHRVCIISGLPGIGKTTLARMLMLYFYNRKFDVVKIVGDISEALSVGYHEKPRFFYYDDFLGQTAQADKLNKNEDQRLLDFMTGVRDSKHSVFVLTTREYILNQARMHYEKLAREKFNHRICIIDLSKYSRRIRAQILYNHLHFSRLPRHHLKALAAKRGYIQVVDHKNYNPRLIEYLTDLAWIGEISSDEYLELFLRKLDNPVDIWEHAFRNQLTNKARHLLFILTTMPKESRLHDVEKAFIAFHNSQCGRFHLPHSPTDFLRALKELDGTFVATRSIRNQVLLQFHNPSIRDFMQNILLGGELLSEVIISLSFFEQARWFVKKLNEEKPPLYRKELVKSIPQIADSLQRLLCANSCSFSTEGSQLWERILDDPENPVERIATVASFNSNHINQIDFGWIDAELVKVAESLINRKISASVIVSSVVTLKELGHLNSAAGKQLCIALKEQATGELFELIDFETLGIIIEIFPEFFDELEIQSARANYTEYVDQYISDCDISNPDELRDEALRIVKIGEVFQVDTKSAQSFLKERADELEFDEGQDWERDDDSKSIGNSGECSDGELDSMFRTLTS